MLERERIWSLTKDPKSPVFTRLTREREREPSLTCLTVPSYRTYTPFLQLPSLHSAGWVRMAGKVLSDPHVLLQPASVLIHRMWESETLFDSPKREAPEFTRARAHAIESIGVYRVLFAGWSFYSRFCQERADELLIYRLAALNWVIVRVSAFLDRFNQVAIRSFVPKEPPKFRSKVLTGKWIFSVKYHSLKYSSHELVYSMVPTNSS